ncbi:hypothetical protein SCOCK_150117 [Actinacidiphila cocklensis]|uniref:Uncharacterized protein n=1 Tax=Actinacidiphila cocklensis TaxID=887465 RepID=A0A9W4GP65_9ACTN|nr:hypothetical protein SCOCK_150117 [Actinacidiphila cocklensis]
MTTAELGDSRAGGGHFTAAQPRVGPAPQPGLLGQVVAAQQSHPEASAAGLVAALFQICRPRPSREGLVDHFQLLYAPGRVVFGGVQEGVGEGHGHRGSLAPARPAALGGLSPGSAGRGTHEDHDVRLEYWYSSCTSPAASAKSFAGVDALAGDADADRPSPVVISARAEPLVTLVCREHQDPHGIKPVLKGLTRSQVVRKLS